MRTGQRRTRNRRQSLIMGFRLIFVGLLLPFTILMMNFLPRAIAANTAPFTFSVAGDYGGNFASGSNLQKVISAIAVKNPAFHIAVGDLGYNDTNPTNWCNSFKANYSKLVLVTGNHDTLNSAGQLYPIMRFIFISAGIT